MLAAEARPQTPALPQAPSMVLRLREKETKMGRKQAGNGKTKEENGGREIKKGKTKGERKGKKVEPPNSHFWLRHWGNLLKLLEFFAQHIK